MPVASRSRSRGTLASEVSDDPPMARRSIDSSRCFSTREPAGDGTGRLQLPRVALPVMNGQRTQREALGFGDRRGGIGIEAAAQEYYRSHLVNW